MDRQIIGNAGLFYVSYQLSIRNWNVLITSRNSRGADIIAISESGDKSHGIQVKTNSEEMDIRLSKNYKHLSIDYWIIVYNVFTKPESYIIPSKDIEKSHKALIEDNSLSSKMLVTSDKISKSGNQNFWIYKNFLREYCGLDLYYEKWDYL